MSLYLFAPHVLSHNPFPIFLLNTYMVGCAFSAAALCGIHPQKKNLSGVLSYGVQGQVRMGAKSHSDLTNMVSRSEKAVFSTIFCLEWRGWVITHKDKLAHFPGLQYVSNLLRRILHAAQVTNIASDLVKIAKLERLLVLLDDQHM